jgi:hypothetical protein
VVLEKDGDQLDRSYRNEEVLHRLKETTERWKANWISNVFRRNSLVKHVIEAKIEVTGRRERRRKQLLDDLKEKRRYWKLKAGAVSLWRILFGRAVDLL